MRLAAIRTIDHILDGVHPDERDEVIYTFNELPMTARVAIDMEIAQPLPDVQPYGADGIASFGFSPESAAFLRDHWGPLAGQKLATAVYRLHRVLQAMPRGDAVAAVRWANSVSPGTAISTMRALAG